VTAPSNLGLTILGVLDAAPAGLSYAFLTHGQPIERVNAPALAELIRRHAAGYREAGIPARTVVPLLVGSSPSLWAAFVGAMCADLVPCVWSTPTFKTHLPTYLRNITTLLARYGSTALVASATYRAHLDPVLKECAPGLTLHDIEKIGRSEAAEVAPRSSGDDVAFLQHSSGSTGTPKGVALSHAAVLAHMDAYARAIALDPATDRIASWLPLYHDMGLVSSFLMPLVKGVPAVTMPPADWIVDPCTILDVITSEQSTLAWWPNFTFALLSSRVRAEQLDVYDLSSVRMIVNCSEPVMARSHAEFRRVFADCGLKDSALQTSYAMAENVFAVTQTSGRGPRRAILNRARLELGSVVDPVHVGHTDERELMSSGRPIAGVRLQVVDAERRAQPDGYVGEIAIAGPWLFREYLQLPDETRAARDAEWYFTGDVGFVHEGDLFVLGRKTDLIIVGGRKFYPDEIERIAASVEGVKEGRAVAFGLVDEERGTEEVVVLVESAHHDSRARVQEIRKEIKGRVLRELDVTVDHTRVLAPQTLIKTSSGKLARRDNRVWFAAQRAASRDAAD